MATKTKVSTSSWLLGSLPVPIGLALVVPVRQLLYDAGFFSHNYQTDFLGLRSFYLTLGIAGVITLLLTAFAAYRAKRLGELPAHKGLIALLIAAAIVAFGQMLLLLRALY